MPLKFRPFGILGSTLEVLAGVLLVRGVLWTGEDYPVGFTATLVCVGVVLVLAGVFGIVAAGRDVLAARRDPRHTG